MRAALLELSQYNIHGAGLQSRPNLNAPPSLPMVHESLLLNNLDNVSGDLFHEFFFRPTSGGGKVCFTEIRGLELNAWHELWLQRGHQKDFVIQSRLGTATTQKPCRRSEVPEPGFTSA